MSQYEYYEFLAVDRRLTEGEIERLRLISTRADVTPTHFSNVYNYGSLSADPDKLLERYFDLHVYVANWGTQRLALRLPGDVLPLDDVAPYCVGDGVSARKVDGRLIIDFSSETEDPEGWVDGRPWMGSLAGARDALLRGDNRALYLGWLASVSAGEVDEDDEEPPVPPGLQALPGPLASLAKFLRIDEHLIDAAAEASAPERPQPTGMVEWISALPPEDKDAFLVRVAEGEHVAAAAALHRRFRSEGASGAHSAGPRRRAVGELIARAGELEEAEARKAAKRAAEARRKRDGSARRSGS